ncbi:MAG: hypothetical protein FWG54_06595 [Bacteroidetes bacterium]|nr:hypothetical protein [Bacteroidota bacterium]
MKRWLLWLIAFVITVAAAIYQRTTGPTHPKSIEASLLGGRCTFSCPRSLSTEITPQQAQKDWENLGKTSLLQIGVKEVNEEEKEARLFYKRAYSQEDWKMVDLKAGSDGHLEALLPAQPPAGKLAYYIEVSGVALSKESPIIIRFRNPVPAWALIPHILFMFAAMLLSTFCGLLSLRKGSNWKNYAWCCLAILLAGGLILGPIVQKFAFGAFWSGWPVGEDLTDTKTLIAACFWIVALLFSRKKSGRWLAIVAAVSLLVVFSIPHSTSGSEFNYQTGVIETGP